MKNIITKYQETGICKIDINNTLKYKNVLFISQWKNEYRLIVHTPKTKRLKMKLTISKEQACILIGKLNLINIPDTIFNSGSTWEIKEADNGQ